MVKLLIVELLVGEEMVRVGAVVSITRVEVSARLEAGRSEVGQLEAESQTVSELIVETVKSEVSSPLPVAPTV